MPRRRPVDPLLLCSGPAPSAPATCRHACTCACHVRPNEVKHQVGCCVNCGHGHTRIEYFRLDDHLRECHLKL